MENNLSHKRSIKLSSNQADTQTILGWASWQPPMLSFPLYPVKMHNFKIDECSVLGWKLV